MAGLARPGFEGMLADLLARMGRLERGLGGLRAPRQVISDALPDPSTLRPGTRVFDELGNSLVVNPTQDGWITLGAAGGAGGGLTLFDVYNALQNGTNHWSDVSWDSTTGSDAIWPILTTNGTVVTSYPASRAGTWAKVAEWDFTGFGGGYTSAAQLSLIGTARNDAPTPKVHFATVHAQAHFAGANTSPTLDLVVSNSTSLLPSDAKLVVEDPTWLTARIGLYFSIPSTIAQYDFRFQEASGQKMNALGNPVFTEPPGIDAGGWLAAPPSGTSVTGRAPTYV